MMVNILDRFEQRVERVMEGGIGRLFRSPLQPAEIGRKLERAMSERQVTSVGGTLVPNHFQVSMHPQDLTSFADYQSALCRQLEAWLSEVAERRGFTVVDPIRVELSGNDRLPRRAVDIEASISDKPRAGGEIRPDGPALGRNGTRPAAGPPRLRFINGPQRNLETPIRQSVTTIGRAPANDLVLDVSDVSRHHARLDYHAGSLRVVDLGSTNGTRVNGKAVRQALLRPGDEISFGTVRAQVLPVE